MSIAKSDGPMNEVSNGGMLLSGGINSQITYNSKKFKSALQACYTSYEMNGNNVMDNSVVKLSNNKRRYLSRLIGFNVQELVEYLMYNHEKFLEILNDYECDLDMLSLIFDVILKACSGVYSACNKFITNLVQSSSLWLNVIPTVVLSTTCNNDRLLNSLFTAAEAMYAATLDDSIIIYMEKLMREIPNKVEHEIKSRFLKLKDREISPWSEINDNCRSSESIFISQVDLTNVCFVKIHKRSIIGSYDTICNYLDCYFFLIKDSIIDNYRKKFHSYWEEGNSAIHNTIIENVLFLDDGIHLSMSLPFSKPVTELFHPGIELCMSVDDFSTLEFASVFSVNNDNNFIEVKLITVNSDMLIKGKKCAIMESITDGNLYSKVLAALRNQKDLALGNLIVKLEKPFKLPNYINTSQVLEFTPLSCFATEEWFETINNNNNVTLKIKILNKIWPFDKFGIPPQEVNMIKEMLQRELALVKANNDLSRSLCLNLLKILEINRSVWQKKEHCPILILCSSEQMLEDLSVECVNFSKKPIMLHDKLKLERKDNQQLKKQVREHGKRINHILNQIDIGKKYPLEVLGYEEALKFHECNTLQKQNKILEWLCLTKNTYRAYNQLAKEYNYVEILRNDKQNNYIANAFNIKDEMNEDEANNVSDIWSLCLVDRWRLVRYWKTSVIDDLERVMNNEKQHYDQLLDILNELCCKSDYKIIRDASIILSTSKTAINNIEVINNIKSCVKIIFVLEANEIPESFLIPFLHSNIEHLILFGSVDQSLSNMEETNISISMYDRLIANDIPYIEWSETFKTNNKMQTEKRLNCGHVIHYPSNVENFKCKELIHHICRCGKQVNIPCSEEKSYKCNEISTVCLACNHYVSIKCAEKDTFDFKCKKQKDIQLPCLHTVKIACSELTEKREDYFNNGCHNKCKNILNCGHECMGICSNCITTSVHESCEKVCQVRLNCGHQCKGKCGAPCSPCSLPCEWECPHGTCDKLCGDICSVCHDLCTWRCPHYKCSKQCWEECDRPLCEKDCPLTLSCGHSCVGVCGETCPSLCSVCDPEKYENFILPDCSQILELKCGHMFSRITLISTLDSFQQNTKPICPLCNIPIENKGFVGTYVRKWHRLSMKEKDYILSILNDGIRSVCYDQNVITAQYHSAIGSILKAINKTKNLSLFILAKTHILYIIQLNDIENKVKLFTNLKPEHNDLLNKCIRMRTWLGKHWLKATFNQMREISWKIYCMHLLVTVYEKKLRTKKFKSKQISEVYLSCDRLIRHLLKKEPYSAKYEETLKQHLAKINELDKNLEKMFPKLISSVTEEQFHQWLKGKISKTQIIWNKKT